MKRNFKIPRKDIRNVKRTRTTSIRRLPGQKQERLLNIWDIIANARLKNLNKSFRKTDAKITNNAVKARRKIGVV